MPFDSVLEEEKARRRKPVFDPTINLGHILTFLGFMVMIFTTWTTLDKRVVILEEARKAQEVQDRMQDQRANEARTEIRDTLNKVERALERLNDKMDQQSGHTPPITRR
jgi:hypothetical protein